MIVMVMVMVIVVEIEETQVSVNALTPIVCLGRIGFAIDSTQ